MLSIVICNIFVKVCAHFSDNAKGRFMPFPKTSTKGVCMDAVAQASSSIEAVNQVLEIAQKATVKEAEKLMKATVAMAVGMELGKGQAIDVSG